MAIIKYGHLISEARGKLNGTVFSRNAYGAYMRAKATPSNPQTPHQSRLRTFFTNASQRWRVLPDLTRHAWNNVSVLMPRSNVFGDNAPLSGFNLFVAINVNLQLCSKPMVNDPPVFIAPVSITELGFQDLFVDEVTLTFKPTPTPAKSDVALLATPPLSPGKSYFTNDLRLLKVYPLPVTSPLNITTEYTQRFGWPTLGRKVVIGLYTIHDESGVASSPIFVSGIVS